jgi:glycosyltransferase involved in cell wall biosynthesis
MRVAYSGFFVDSSGYGEMTRRYLLALESAEGLDATPAAILADGGWQLPAAPQLQLFLSKVRVGAPDVHLLCVAGADMPKIYPQDIPKFTRRVGIMCWETDRLHPSVIEGIRSVDHVIVPSQHNVEVLARAGIKASCVPIPMEVPTYIDNSPFAEIEGLKDDTFIFYSMLTWQERKNPLKLISAYCNAFTDKDDVMLVLKISGPDADQAARAGSKAVEAILGIMSLRDAPKILVLGGRWHAPSIWAFHDRGDCYISMAKGEAYAIPMLDAAAIGNRVIATGYGGHLDFLPREHSRLIPYRMEPVLQKYSHFDGRQCWAEPDVLAAAAMMRAEFEVGRLPKVRPGLSHLLPYAVGTKLEEALHA